MSTSTSLLPTTFRSTFERAKTELVAALAALDAQPGSEHEHALCRQLDRGTQDLLALSPDLAYECLGFAHSLESNLVALVEQKIAEHQLEPSDAYNLRTPLRRALRAFHFTGEMALLLDYFREHYLSATEDGNLRKMLREQGQVVEETIERLLGHVVSEVCLEAQERTALREAARALQRFRTVTPTDGGLTKDDHTVRRRQFIRVVGLLCLRLYGHCTTDVMARLLELKTAHYLQPYGSEDENNEDVASDDAINRELAKLKLLARRRAQVENWENGALVEAFFGRSHWKAWRPD